MKEWEIIELIEEFDKKNYIENEDNFIKEIFNDNKKEKILCIGQVQSGKTRKIIECIKYSLYEKKYDIIIFVAGTNNTLYKQSKQRIIDSNIDGYDSKIKILFKEDIKQLSYREGFQYLLVISKGGNGTDLKNVLDFLTPINKYDKNILFIDDESDYASTNNEKGNESEIYKNMLESYDKVKNGKFLFVTATPFANLTSLNSIDMKPDKVYVWNANDGYCGLKEFNNSNIYEIVKSNKNNEVSYLSDVEEVFNYFIKTILLNYSFFKNDINNEISCLFNVSLDTDVHEKIYDKIHSLINFYNNNQNSFFEKNNIDINEENKNILFKILRDEISIIILNEGNKKNNITKKFNIYISGVMASRGNTFENLIAQLNINSPNEGRLSADTLLQRCRWFGYRKNIFKYMKIFINNDIKESLIESERYLNLLTIGPHDADELCKKIKLIDNETIYVKSTSKR